MLEVCMGEMSRCLKLMFKPLGSFIQRGMCVCDAHMYIFTQKYI